MESQFVLAQRLEDCSDLIVAATCGWSAGYEEHRKEAGRFLARLSRVVQFFVGRRPFRGAVRAKAGLLAAIIDIAIVRGCAGAG